ncbi:MAG: hypothetical protein JW830_13455 [Bacteroidales bacterium]|nr:hypothetical protein [Bacteroidales bacterium]
MKNLSAFTTGIKNCKYLQVHVPDKLPVKYRKSFGLIIRALFSLMILVISDAVSGQVIESATREAYQLRVNGKAEQAEEMLRQYLKSDSTDAVAWFELARTCHHIFLGKGEFTPEAWQEVTGFAHRAVRYAPDNEVYAYYYAYYNFLNAFISMMRELPDAGEKITQTCDAYNAVLLLNPKCDAAKFYLIDMYGLLPAEMGGDKAKAEVIADGMKSGDKTYYAMAQAKLLPDTSNLVAYWQNVGRETGMNAQVLEELGRAYLLKSDTENGVKYFKDAIQADHSKKYLTMNLVRYYLMAARQDPNAKENHLKSATDLVNSYLQSSPEPNPPLKAYAYSTLSMINMFGGDRDTEKKYRELADSIDPFCSKATGMAPDMLYCPPDEVKIQYSSFFMPF